MKFVVRRSLAKVLDTVQVYNELVNIRIRIQLSFFVRFALDFYTDSETRNETVHFIMHQGYGGS